MNHTYLDANRRHDFIFLFDVTDGNPNGDPDAGNLPRQDPETGQGLVTDVCIKRKIRDFVDLAHGSEGRFKIYIQNKGIALNTLHDRAYQALEEETGQSIKAKNRPDLDTLDKVRRWMCHNFFDIRTFGAVMTTQINCGQVRGPVQLTFSRSCDPVNPLEFTITRVAITRDEDARRATPGDDSGKQKTTEIGRKSLISYGLYRGYGFVNPKLAEQTGFNNDDLTLLWDAFQKMWDLDRSASRGMMAFRGLYIFTHENPLGNALAHTLLERVVTKSVQSPPRRFADYEVAVNDSELPEGVTLTVIP